MAIDRQVRARLINFQKPWQSWIFIDLESPDYDAVYIHTTNPYKVPFPYVTLPGRITRNVSRYKRITQPLARNGYLCLKPKGSSAIIAVPNSV